MNDTTVIGDIKNGSCPLEIAQERWEDEELPEPINFLVRDENGPSLWVNISPGGWVEVEDAAGGRASGTPAEWKEICNWLLGIKRGIKI